MGERENLAPGLSSDFTLNLQPGEYTLNCTFGNAQRDNGKVTVTGTASGSKADDALLAAAVADYKAYVAKETADLVDSTKRFTAALRAGDLDKAKELFGPTRFHYEAVEPIAESFGDLDPEIDARVNDVSDKAEVDGLPPHRADPLARRHDEGHGALRLRAAGRRRRPRRQDRRPEAAARAGGERRGRPARRGLGEQDHRRGGPLLAHRPVGLRRQRRRRARRVRRAQAGARRAGRPAARDPDRRAHVGRRAGASTATSATRRSATPPTPR